MRTPYLARLLEALRTFDASEWTENLRHRPSGTRLQAELSAEHWVSQGIGITRTPAGWLLRDGRWMRPHQHIGIIPQASPKIGDDLDAALGPTARRRVQDGQRWALFQLCHKPGNDTMSGPWMWSARTGDIMKGGILHVVPPYPALRGCAVVVGNRVRPVFADHTALPLVLPATQHGLLELIHTGRSAGWIYGAVP